ncbi:F-actin-capping protein subunit alpha [Mycoemilia scoparia]|uniref:F-actin-capping protein subunit alpha n=1 Tax=Mycoemilia scoparia TaxID=417184 RepID=A0A9W7ZRM4_9FUNG|nr:F-actin-capping protein subunit alpha [Mycoemilia scoparia]
MNSYSLSVEEKIERVLTFLTSSPPGEENDVFNDIRGIINDDQALQDNIVPTLTKLSIERFQVVDIPDTALKTMITQYNQVEDNKYVDFNTKKAIVFDHLREKVVSCEDYEEESTLEELRSLVQKNVVGYLEDRYQEGVGCTFIVDDSKVVVCIVGNKFNPENFWNGSWRSSWIFDTSSGTIEGKVSVHIHYYEDGNVQQISNFDFNEQLNLTDDNSELASSIVKKIRALEQQYHRSLNDHYSQLSQKTFKAFRRMLPITRNKVDWDKIINYKIGESIENMSK